ncbi:hypothetical protein CJ026_000240 [Ralstonia pickettii]|jgi:hypothetical protein|uniref:hypothetical protein n=1 Tax=Ralstonia pickettii TaxID=329 RepID=UPI000BDA2DBF|nr:hypothetical protein [Ralstonia pickettii]MBT2180857.1 hypothetical protein [Ralstonia pickettii]POH90114.1 hypothetical protein CJ026_000240 [Ralstonia pickettii]
MAAREQPKEKRDKQIGLKVEPSKYSRMVNRAAKESMQRGYPVTVQTLLLEWIDEKLGDASGKK